MPASSVLTLFFAFSIIIINRKIRFCIFKTLYKSLKVFRNHCRLILLIFTRKCEIISLFLRTFFCCFLKIKLLSNRGFNFIHIAWFSETQWFSYTVPQALFPFRLSRRKPNHKHYYGCLLFSIRSLFRNKTLGGAWVIHKEPLLGVLPSERMLNYVKLDAVLLKHAWKWVQHLADRKHMRHNSSIPDNNTHVPRILFPGEGRQELWGGPNSKVCLDMECTLNKI